MKMKKIGIVVLAAAVLMAMTVSIAYAQGYSFGPNNMVSHFSGTSVTLDSTQPSGSISVNYDDTLGWGNVFYNAYPTPVDSYVQDYTTPSGGLATTFWFATTVPKDNQGTGTIIFASRVTDGSSHSIAANHLYKYGNNYYGSPYCYGMSYT